VWLLLAAFSQFYSENWQKKVEQKDLKNIQSGQKKSCGQGGVVVQKELSNLAPGQKER
jgi:hypothetical protein